MIILKDTVQKMHLTKLIIHDKNPQHTRKRRNLILIMGIYKKLKANILIMKNWVFSS